MPIAYSPDFRFRIVGVRYPCGVLADER